MMTTKPLRALALVTVVTAVALSTQALVSEAELAPTTSREDSVENPGQVNALEAAETDYGTETELVLNEGPLEVGRYFYLKPVSSPGLCVATAGLLERVESRSSSRRAAPARSITESISGK